MKLNRETLSTKKIITMEAKILNCPKKILLKIFLH